MIETPVASELKTSWRVNPPAPPRAVERLVRELSLPPLLAAMVWNRDLHTDASSKLSPPLEPTSIPDLAAAAGRLETALRRKERILIHGDYDADGISGSAVLLLGLRALGGNVAVFIPNRLEDGYGIHPDRVEEHIEACELLVTVDCGIGNAQEVARVRQAGVGVIVTDHHLPGERLPECLIVHPRFSPDARPGRPELTGAGVAYHLLWALHQLLGLEAPLEYSDLAAIGTIADVAPLLGENRALVRTGLQRMSDSRWPGLRAAIAQSGLRNGLTARDVAFVLAPRLNAAGRLGEADKGLELLTTSSKRRALELAAYLDARNDDRRKIQDEMFTQALSKVEVDAPALVLTDDQWHPGVMGIVASKLLERFYKPVFIIAKGKGSVRSTPGISAVDALSSARAHLLRYGGHAQAAGFAIEEGNISAFGDAIRRFVGTHPAPVRAVEADAVVTGEEVDAEFYSALKELEPFGEGNPAPLLALTDRLESARAVGREGATLQLRVGGLRGVAWQKGELAAQLSVGQPVNAAVCVREREWKGKRELEFVAEEIRISEPLQLPLRTTEVPGGERISVKRGPAPYGEPLLSLEGAPTGAPLYWLRRLPLPDDPLESSEPLCKLAISGAALYLDLGERALAEAQQAARQLATVADVRRGFVYLQRGASLPFGPGKQALVRRILTELDLLDSLGRVRRGHKRNPYSSTTMVRSLMQRYWLLALVNAYRSLDDPGFALAAAVLLGAEA